MTAAGISRLLPVLGLPTIEPAIRRRRYRAHNVLRSNSRAGSTMALASFPAHVECLDHLPINDEAVDERACHPSGLAPLSR
jgi:hypothetical protein